MSVQAMAWAFKQDIESPGAKLVLLALANYASNDKGDCFPGQERLAADTSQSTRTIRRHLGWLEDNGFIDRQQRRRGDGSRTSDHIVLCFKAANRTECPPADQPDKMSEPTGQTAYESPDKMSGHEPSVEPSEIRTPPISPPARGARPLESNWRPCERSYEVGRKEGYADEETDWLADGMRDWSPGKRKADWDRTFNNWLRSDISHRAIAERRKSRGVAGPRGRQGSNTRLDAIRDVSARLRGQPDEQYPDPLRGDG